MLVVAVCAGARCRGLRELHDPSAAEAGPAGAELRDAVRNRSDAVLITTGCLGACERGCVAAVGTGSADGHGHVTWHGRPVGLGLVELAGRSAEFAAWVRDSAPDLTTLPAPLWQVGAGQA